MIGRRTWITAGVAAGAAAAGVVVGWRPWETPPPTVPPSVWQQQWPTPDGGMLTLESFKGRPLVLNFWATWCPPCVRELPALERFARDHAAQGWQVVALAIDDADAVREFLKRTPVALPIGISGLDGSQAARALGNERAALPFTVLVDSLGAIRAHKLGESTYDDLVGWTRLLAAPG